MKKSFEWLVRSIAVLYLLIIGNTDGKAQFSIGPQVGYTHFFGYNSNPSAGLRMEYAFNCKFSIHGSFNGWFKGAFNEKDTVKRTNTIINPPPPPIQPVDVKYTVTGGYTELGAKAYFYKEQGSNFSLYGIGGIIFASMVYDWKITSYYDQNLYFIDRIHANPQIGLGF